METSFDRLNRYLEDCHRIALSEAVVLLECANIAEAEAYVCERGKDYAIGVEEGRKYIVSVAKAARQALIAEYLAKNNAASVEVLAIYLGVAKSNYLYELQYYPDGRKLFEIKRTKCYLPTEHHPVNTKNISSVSCAARSLLIPDEAQKEAIKRRCEGRVLRKLLSVWSRRELVLTIDGGLTNLQVATALAKTPLAHTHIATITYVTNSPLVAKAIHDNQKQHLHDAVLVGGRLRVERNTYIGRYAEACFLALNVRPDVAFIAASTVNKEGEFCCSDFEENRFKALMLGHPEITLRCIVADSSKISAGVSNGWAFASLENIDVVVTDCLQYQDAPEFFDRARAFGVLVHRDPACDVEPATP